MLDVVRRHLNKAGVRCVTIKGDVTPKHRADIVDSFNADESGPEVSSHCCALHCTVVCLCSTSFELVLSGSAAVASRGRSGPQLDRRKSSVSH